MRILLTSILCQSGLMTHVNDLARFLAQQGIFVAIAFRRANFLDWEAKKRILARLGKIPYVLYDRADELQQFVLEKKCTLIHAHSHMTFPTATEVSLSLDIPLIITLHSVYPWHRVYRRTLQASRRIIAVGAAQAHAARGFLEQIEVVPNGIDTEFFVPKDEQDTKGDPFNILWYGRVDGRLSRGLQVLDQVAPLLPGHIRISGLGTAHPQPTNITMLPWTDNPLPYLQQSQITFAHGRSLREAMACGSIGMLLGYGYGGLVTGESLRNEPVILDAFPEYRLARPRVSTLRNDILAMANQVSIIRLRKEARALAVKHFSIKEMGERVVRIYRSASKGKRS